MRTDRMGGIAFTVAVFALACGGDPEPPKLTVVIVVDQMRADYMDRFADGFTGFSDAHQDHARTETAAGHATLATGVFPSRHGIVGNSFYNRSAEARQYSVGDSTSPIVGFADDAGRSPANLLTTTIGDWLVDASPDSKRYSIAIKDRSTTEPRTQPGWRHSTTPGTQPRTSGRSGR